MQRLEKRIPKVLNQSMKGKCPRPKSRWEQKIRTSVAQKECHGKQMMKRGCESTDGGGGRRNY